MDTTALHLHIRHEDDEHAWLLEQAAAVVDGRLSDVDCEHLGEYLNDMAARDQREVRSRLAVLLTHIVKCHVQPERVSASWANTIIEQQDELRDIFGHSQSLRRGAAEELASLHKTALRRASVQTGVNVTAVPAGLDDLSFILAFEVKIVEHPSAGRRSGRGPV